MTEKDAILILNAVPGISNLKTSQAMERLGSAREVLLNPQRLIKEGILSSGLTQKIIDFLKDSFLEREYRQIEQHGVQVVTFHDEEYPSQLKDIYDAPCVLYCKGNVGFLKNICVSMVGSRRSSFYGLDVAEKLARQLSECGITVVSGLARGIDSYAHQGALLSLGKTIAVLGNGLSHVYPAENKNLYERIAKEGLLVSEFCMETPPHTFNFPRRNRIVSGLSLGVVVVEAMKKSGALITAKIALEQGKDVFAVPHNIGHPNALGVHQLIKEGAKLIQNVEDIIEEIRPHIESKLTVSKEVREDHSKKKETGLNPKPSLTAFEEAVYALIDHAPVFIDELVNKTQMTTDKIASVLFHLELKKLVRQLPGKYFVRGV